MVSPLVLLILLGATATSANSDGPWLEPLDRPSWCPHGRTLFRMLRQEPPGLVLDVGSFDGRDAISFGKAGHQVWSFEPSPGKVGPIRERIAAADLAANVTLLPYALSNATGSAPFVVNRAGAGAKKMFRGEWGSAQDGLGKPLWRVDNHTAAIVQVPMRRLDDLLPPGQEVLLLKVDAQGYDYHVLLGAARLLAAKRVRRLVAEIMPLHTPGGPETTVQMVAFLNSVGYACSRCNGPKERGQSARARVRVREYAMELARPDKGISNRGVNFGRWDDIVCEPSAHAGAAAGGSPAGVR